MSNLNYKDFVKDFSFEQIEKELFGRFDNGINGRNMRPLCRK